MSFEVIPYEINQNNYYYQEIINNQEDEILEKTITQTGYFELNMTFDLSYYNELKDDINKIPHEKKHFNFIANAFLLKRVNYEHDNSNYHKVIPAVANGMDNILPIKLIKDFIIIGCATKSMRLDKNYLNENKEYSFNFSDTEEPKSTMFVLTSFF